MEKKKSNEAKFNKIPEDTGDLISVISKVNSMWWQQNTRLFEENYFRNIKTFFKVAISIFKSMKIIPQFSSYLIFNDYCSKFSQKKKLFSSV